jgi:hypothetical protein
MSRLPSATSGPSSLTACQRLTYLTSPPYTSVPCPTEPCTFSVFSLDQQYRPFSWSSWTFGLASYWFARWQHESPVVPFSPMASQWELRSTLPFSSCFLYNLKFPASRFLGFATCFHAGILLDLFDPEDGGDMFIWNVDWHSTDYTALYPEDNALHTRKIYRYLKSGGADIHGYLSILIENLFERTISREMPCSFTHNMLLLAFALYDIFAAQKFAEQYNIFTVKTFWSLQ